RCRVITDSTRRAARDLAAPPSPHAVCWTDAPQRAQRRNRARGVPLVVVEQRTGTSKRRTATAVTGSALQQRRDPTLHERAERWERRLAIPVLVAALVSVPAIFLMTT